MGKAEGCGDRLGVCPRLILCGGIYRNQGILSHASHASHAMKFKFVEMGGECYAFFYPHVHRVNAFHESPAGNDSCLRLLHISHHGRESALFCLMSTRHQSQIHGCGVLISNDASIANLVEFGRMVESVVDRISSTDSCQKY